LNPQAQSIKRQQGFGKTKSDGIDKKFATIRELAIRSKQPLVVLSDGEPEAVHSNI